MTGLTSRRNLLGAMAASLALPVLARPDAAQAGLWQRFSQGFGKSPEQGPVVTTPFPEIGYSDWTEAEPHYRLYPGDQIEIAVTSAPELSRSLVVQPDGRITLPLIGSVMVADRSVPEIEDALVGAYGPQLLRPEVQITVRSFTSLKVFVMGEVRNPGVFEMPGDINAIQAIAQAGGLLPSARSKEIVVIRRGPAGEPMVRTANIRRALYQASPGDMVPLRRFDIIFVPRSGIAEAGLFVQQYLKDLQPVSLGFSYALNGVNR